jgi:hypothetical protein
MTLARRPENDEKFVVPASAGFFSGANQNPAEAGTTNDKRQTTNDFGGVVHVAGATP